MPATKSTSFFHEHVGHGASYSSQIPDILGLAQELIDEILGYVSPNDLLTLRFISKNFADRTEKAMLEANFGELLLMPDYLFSLHRCMNILEHKKYRSAVKSIFIDVDQFHLLLENQRFEDLDGGEIGEDCRWNRHKFLSPLGFWKGPLRQLLAHLPAMPCDVRLSFVSLTHFRQRRPLKHQNEWWKFQRRFCQNVPRDGDLGEVAWSPDGQKNYWKLLQNTLIALKDARVQLSMLSASDWSVQGFGAPLSLFSGSSSTLGLRHTFDNVQCLALGVQHYHVDDTLNSTSEHAETFVKFLGSISKSLKFLRLATPDTDHTSEQLLANVFKLLVMQQVAFPKL